MANLKLESSKLIVAGVLDRNTVPELQREAHHLLRRGEVQNLDLSGIESLDSAGVAFLECLKKDLEEENPQLTVIAAPLPILKIMRTFADKAVEVEKPATASIFESLGQKMEDAWLELKDAVLLCSELFWWSIVGMFDRKGQKKGSFTSAGVQLGYDALPVVALLSFIIGFILSLQSAAQLKIYGGNVFLPDLLAITMVREMGPLITAVIVAGRSGSAIASEIATMQVSEEIDALRMMALNPIRYVVVPKFHAITVVMPLLVVFSIIVAEIGGVLIGLQMLDLSIATFITRSIDIISLKDIVISLSKSTVFAWLIVIIGAHYGFRVKGEAEGVGKATTASVVASIFAVIITDALFSLFYLG